jgi:RNA polymerase sigma-70 factor (ECF subfamily)
VNKDNSGIDSWNELALSHLDALYGYAMVLTRNPTDAEDLVQETFVQAVSHFDRIDPNSNLKAWLFTILRNVQFKILRHDRVGPMFVALDNDEVQNRSNEEDDPQSICLQTWEREELRMALEKLPCDFREIIILRYFEEFSYKEIAAISDCPVGTIMSRLSRARDRLGNELKNSRESVPKSRVSQ